MTAAAALTNRINDVVADAINAMTAAAALTDRINDSEFKLIHTFELIHTRHSNWG